MAETVIEVDNISKIYRIGVKEAKKETISATIASWFMAPIRNFTRLRNLSHIRGEEEDTIWALKNISFKVEKGEVLGIIGKNGGGKSTLLKILSRVTDPTHGKATIYGRVASLLEVGTGFHPDLTGSENVYLNGTILGMTKKEVDARLNDIIEFSGIGKFMETPIKRYSSGMKVRLAFAVAAHLDPDILIIDEVLAVGDMDFQRKCLGKMNEVAKGGRTVLFVSHDMSAVKSLCTRAIMLRNGQIAVEGDVGKVVSSYLAGDNRSINGEIEETANRPHGYNFARFTRAMVIDGHKQPLTLLYYRQPLMVLLTLEVLKDFENAAIELHICSGDGTPIAYISLLESERQTLTLKKGTYNFEVEISSEFLPGVYTLSPSVRGYLGKIIDMVEGVYEFTILKASEEPHKHYPWNFIKGVVRADSKWKIPVEAIPDYIPALEQES